MWTSSCHFIYSYSFYRLWFVGFETLFTRNRSHMVAAAKRAGAIYVIGIRYSVFGGIAL